MSTLQQINLFRPEFQQEKHPFRFVTMLIAWGLIVIFFGSLQLWGWYQTESTREQLASMEHQQTRVLQQLKALSGLTPRNNKAQLESNLLSAQAEVTQRRKLLKIMKGQSVGNAQGFSDYMISLSRQHMDGLSLEHFKLMEGGDYVELSGWTRKPELVPDYLQRLRSEDTFHDSRFGDMAIERVADQPSEALRFILGEAIEGGS
jgi:hypothetical protein